MTGHGAPVAVLLLVPRQQPLGLVEVAPHLTVAPLEPQVVGHGSLDLPLVGEAVAGSLRESGAFELVKLTRAKRRVGLPVVRREEGLLADGTAPLLVSRLAASSSRHPFTLEADLGVLARGDQRGVPLSPGCPAIFLLPLFQ